MAFDRKKYLFVVEGATASGKTAFAIALAQHFGAIILSADSRQFYHEMRIGNARPTAEELSQATHYFVADRSVENILTAGAFAREAEAVLEKHYQTHDYAVLVGGSGLFVKALCEGLNEFPEVSDTIRQKVDALFESQGLQALQAALAQADPIYYQEVDKNNPSRLKRALEVCYAGDHPYSYYRQMVAEQKSFEPVYFHVSRSRDELYERINKRVDIMVEEGLEQEASNLYAYKDLAVLKTVGYQEWFAYFDGQYDRARAIELVKQNSRRYAKRQLTWQRRNTQQKHVYKGDLRTALAYVQLLQEQGIYLSKPQVAVQAKSNKYRVAHTALSKEGQELASCQSRIYKTAALICDWEMDQLNHLAKHVLLHEALHRAEQEVVYAYVATHELKLFEGLGFKESEKQEIPKQIAAARTNDLPLLFWKKSEQSF